MAEPGAARLVHRPRRGGGCSRAAARTRARRGRPTEIRRGLRVLRAGRLSALGAQFPWSFRNDESSLLEGRPSIAPASLGDRYAAALEAGGVVVEASE